MRWIYSDKTQIMDNVIDIVPGKYKDNENEMNKVYIEERLFGYIEDIIEYRISDYSHWGYNEISSHKWLEIINDIRELIVKLKKNENIIFSSPNIEYKESNKMSTTFKKNLLYFLNEFIEYVLSLINKHQYVTIIGL